MNSVVAGRDWKFQLTLQAFILPAMIVVVLISYFPMYGVSIAFKNYNIFKGIANSPIASNGGFEHVYALPIYSFKVKDLQRDDIARCQTGMIQSATAPYA